ncbi:MAG: GrpB family protein [Clostridia bacterium]|nr:GrpB family protein [Clostridia bacterium]
MRSKSVEVVPYSYTWAESYELIKAELLAAVGDFILGIEHVGSTAVEGLSAKPCIDIDIIIEDYSMLDTVINQLATIGYVHEGDLGIKDREAFKYTNKPHLENHHLYVCPKSSNELHRHITFRNYLKTHPEAVVKYSKIKEEAAKLFPNDIDQYIAYKTPCIEELYAACGLL